MPRKVEFKVAPGWEHPPGSVEAIRQGCTCSQVKNRLGKGNIQPGEVVYYPSRNCPMHGLAVAQDLAKQKGTKPRFS
jgi:hypothetical protein